MEKHQIKIDSVFSRFQAQSSIVAWIITYRLGRSSNSSHTLQLGHTPHSRHGLEFVLEDHLAHKCY